MTDKLPLVRATQLLWEIPVTTHETHSELKWTKVRIPPGEAQRRAGKPDGWHSKPSQMASEEAWKATTDGNTDYGQLPSKYKYSSLKQQVLFTTARKENWLQNTLVLFHKKWDFCVS